MVKILGKGGADGKGSVINQKEARTQVLPLKYLVVE